MVWGMGYGVWGMGFGVYRFYGLRGFAWLYVGNLVLRGLTWVDMGLSEKPGWPPLHVRVTLPRSSNQRTPQEELRVGV